MILWFIFYFIFRGYFQNVVCYQFSMRPRDSERVHKEFFSEEGGSRIWPLYIWASYRSLSSNFWGVISLIIYFIVQQFSVIYTAFLNFVLLNYFLLMSFFLFYKASQYLNTLFMVLFMSKVCGRFIESHMC